MLSKETREFHQARHDQLVDLVRKSRPHDAAPQYSEEMWERTLSEITGGAYDGVVGLRLFVAELLARSERQAFIDSAAKRLCVIARPGSEANESQIKNYARIAYAQAEALWRERQDRRNRGSDEVPF